jgi:hypothetical protein
MQYLGKSEVVPQKRRGLRFFCAEPKSSGGCLAEPALCTKKALPERLRYLNVVTAGYDKGIHS